MRSFPMFFRTSGRRVVIAGGGEQAAQKARLILKTDARIVLVAPALEPELAGLVADGRAEHRTGAITPDSFADAALVFIATGSPVADVALHALAKRAGATVNVVDRPALCDVTTPSIVDRDPVVVAIGTEGTAPVLGRSIKTQVEQMLDPRLGSFAALAGRLRDAVAERVPEARRRAFWRWALTETPWRTFRRGGEREAARLMKQAIADGGPKEGGQGQIALVGAGPGARDLLTLRAVERLQEADVVFYDRLVDPAALELARRDAERVHVGKTVGAHAWPQERISALIVAEARKGRRVVRLKSGDPSIFGRATEELEAARAAGLPCEIVPGVTAASAAAAATGDSLTRRGETDTLVLATGTCRAGDRRPDWAYHIRPGTTLVFYMAVRTAGDICDKLLRAGLGPDAPVTVAAEVSQAGERIVETSLAGLDCALRDSGITGSAVIRVTCPKTAALAPGQPMSRAPLAAVAAP